MGSSGLGPRIPFYTPLFWGLAQKACSLMGSSGLGPRILCGWASLGLGPESDRRTPPILGHHPEGMLLDGLFWARAQNPLLYPPILGPRPEGVLLDGLFWARAQNPLLYPPYSGASPRRHAP